MKSFSVTLPMITKPNFAGLDWLKFIAALLVVANHTGPLTTYSPYGDFLFSSLLTRIAVPVFFLTSGFLFFRKLTGDSVKDKLALRGYLLKIGKLYGIAILLFIPLNLYTGYFNDHFSAYSFMMDLVFNGTFYHLWYLPALLIGIGMTYFMYKRMSMQGMLIATGLLYFIGLLGDSYYGLVKDVNGISQVYTGMFTVFEYTRNGLFYAPIYLALGAWAAKRGRNDRKPIVNASLFLLSLAFMFAEGMLLHDAKVPRHDSMYVFALPAAYFLFQWALQWKGKSGKAFREWRVWIYILHPIAIVLVRGASKAVHFENLFILNSLLHFITVCLLSIVMAAVAVRISSSVARFRR